jgi:hypothetical protein
LYNKKMKRGERDAIYPQVWLALGFKIVPRMSRTAPRVSLFNDNNGKRRKTAASKPPDEGCHHVGQIEDVSTLESEYDRLKGQLVKLQSERLGAMYPEVYKMLRFRKPKPVNELPPASVSEPPKPKPFVPEPPSYNFAPTIIDVGVLAGEIDSGRYPSMNRLSNDDAVKHAEECYICKDSRGLMYLCDFFNRANHLECIRSRFIIKDPEPHDDFMCNKCIQDIVTRRRRAERRRRQKEGPKAAPEAEGGVARPGQASFATAQAKGLVDPGNEVEFLGNRTKNVDDIIHLLKDSQSRLKHLVETTKVNEFRRSQLMEG